MAIDPKEINEIENSMVHDVDEEPKETGLSRAIMITAAVVIILGGAVALLIGFRFYLK